MEKPTNEALNPYSELDRQISLDRIYLMSLNRLRVLPESTSTWTWGLAIVDKISHSQKELKKSAEIDDFLREKIESDPSNSGSYQKGISNNGFRVEEDGFPHAALAQLRYHPNLLPNMSWECVEIITQPSYLNGLLLDRYKEEGLIEVLEGTKILQLTEAGQSELNQRLNELEI